MDQTQPKRSVLAYVAIVLGALFAIGFLASLVLLPGDLANSDGATLTGNLIGVVLYGAGAFLLLWNGIRRVRRDNRALRS